jgi:hypothetical protein
MRPCALLPWACLLLLLTVALPLFLCMPLWADVIHYDLCARNLLRGGVHYRDTFDVNLPGMAWLHVAVRSLLGWSSEAMRLADFLVVAVIVGLLVCWLRPLGVTRTVRAWTAVALFACYFSLSEWCHCQRDVWMLLPALTALHLRQAQVRELTGTSPSLSRLLLRGAAEGLLWGLAFWIKPFVLVPALACWLMAACGTWRVSPRAVAVDGAVVLAGGLLAIGVGVAWLIGSGAWPYLCEVFTDWMPAYGAADHWPLGHCKLLYRRLSPWSWAHFLALPIALVTLRHSADAKHPQNAQALLAALYLGWLVQALLLQKGFDYNLTPLLPLSLTLLVGLRQPCGGLFLTVLTAVATFQHPLLQADRLALWPRCWSEGSSAALRTRLQWAPGPNTPDWVDLERVAAFLRERGVQDGEVTCHGNTTVPLYLDLDLQPSTRFLHLESLLHSMPGCQDRFCRALSASRQRFVVSDVQSVDSPERLGTLFPWSEPVVFRAGRYQVHEACGCRGDLVSSRH